MSREGKVTTIPTGVEGRNNWCGTAAVGTKLYCPPVSVSSVLVIDSETNTTYPLTRHGHIRPESGIECHYMIAAVGTKLYCPPVNGSSVLVIDSVYNTTTTIPCGVEGGDKWMGIAAVGTKLYCAPSNASSVLVIDSVTNTTTTIPCGVAGKHKWAGITAVGTKLYCAPLLASCVLVIDAETSTTTTIECRVLELDLEKWCVEEWGVLEKWCGIAAVGTKLYCAPLDITSVLVIDSETDTVSTIRSGFLASFDGKFWQGQMWQGIAALGTKLYCAPSNASSVLVIDSVTNTTSSIPCGVAGKYKWMGVAAVGTKLYCPACYASSVLVIEPAMAGG